MRRTSTARRFFVVAVALVCACVLIAAGCVGGVGSVPTDAFPTTVSVADEAMTTSTTGVAEPQSLGSDTTTSKPQPSGWEEYADVNGDSGVDAYQIGVDYIRVRFNGGSIYLYTYASAGQSDIEQMKELARAGDGLNSFIMRNAKYDYESKQR